MSQFQEIFHQSLATMTVGFNEFCAGLGVGWTAPTLNALQKSDTIFPLTPEEFSWIASIDNFGKIFGSLMSAIFLDIIGRKPLLALSALTYFLSWLIIIFSKSVFMICTMRVLHGIASGMESATNSVYLGENSSPLIRGIFGTVSVALYYTGMLCEFVIATYLSYRTTALVNSSISFLLFMGVFWMREPVQFLLMKGNHKQALENYMWLKGVTQPNDVKIEFEKIKLNVQGENLKKASFSKIFTSPANYKSVLIMLLVYILAGMTGYSTIMSYASIAFSSSNILSPNEFTILFGATQLVVVIVASFMIDRFNRRSLILVSFSLIAFIHACTALLYYVQENIFQLTYFPWLIFSSITLYATVYAFTYPAIFLIRGELFPLSIRAIGTCISIIGFSVTNFTMTKIFLFINKNYGIYNNFIIFSLSSCVMVILVYLALPETRNKSLIEIQEILEKQK